MTERRRASEQASLAIRRTGAARLGVLGALTATLVATNRWTGWAAGSRLVSAHDELVYRRIALAAPGLPSARIGNQYAQLFVPNWLAGIVHAGLGIGIDPVYRVLSLAIMLALCLVLRATLDRIGVGTPAFALCLALVVLNTYSLRYYLIAPGYLTDLGFDLCVAVIALGIVAGRYALVLAGVAVAVLVRQSALPVTVVLAGILLLAPPWRSAPGGRRIARAAAVLVLPWALFGLVLLVCAPFSSPTTPGVQGLTVLGAFERLPTGADALFVHVGRALTPVVAVAALLAVTLVARARPPRRQRRPLGGPFWACLVLGVSVWLQAVALNPSYSGHPERLAVLALAPLVVALALALRNLEGGTGTALSPRHATAAVIVLALGSLHYLYTWFGPSTAAEGEILQLVAALAVAAIAWHGLRDPPLSVEPVPLDAAPAGAASSKPS